MGCHGLKGLWSFLGGESPQPWWGRAAAESWQRVSGSLWLWIVLGHQVHWLQQDLGKFWGGLGRSVVSGHPESSLVVGRVC